MSPREFATPEALAAALLERAAAQGNRPLLVAIDGRSGAGKTGLTNALLQILGKDLSARAFRLDDMYQGWEGLAVALDRWQVMSARLAKGQDAGSWLGWDWAANAPTGPHPFPRLAEKTVLLVEGVGALCGAHDVGIWVELSAHLRKARALARDGQTYRPFWASWAAQEEELLAKNPQVYAAVPWVFRQS